MYDLKKIFILKRPSKNSDFHLFGKNRYMKINQPIYPKRNENRRNFYDSKLDLTELNSLRCVSRECGKNTSIITHYSKNSDKKQSTTSLFSVNSIFLKPMRFSLSAK